MNKGIFITGTDTGIGKTFIGAGIASALRRKGVDVGVFKPAETGCGTKRDGTLVPHDALDLRTASGADDPIDLVNPYCFRLPLAPAVAAEQEGRRIDMGKLLKTFRLLSERHDRTLVEGAGGIMVPLTSRLTYLDLAQRLGLPALIVARPNLGTINHTLLTVMALRSRRVPIAGIVINHAHPGLSGHAERTNPSVLERMARVPVLGVVRYGQCDMTRLARALWPS